MYSVATALSNRAQYARIQQRKPMPPMLEVEVPIRKPKSSGVNTVAG
jgi:hypothetical protein